MPTYLRPGVYVEELPSSSSPRANYQEPRPGSDIGSSTQTTWAAEHSITAFLGFANSGPPNSPMLVRRWPEFEGIYGRYSESAYIEGRYLAHAVHGFFENGGRECFVVRIGASDAAEGAAAELPRAADPLLEPSTVGELSQATTQSNLLPTDEHAEVALQPTLKPEEIVPVATERSDIDALDALNVSIVCVPDLASAYERGVLDSHGVVSVQSALISHCESHRDRIAILDPPPNLSAPEMLDWRLDTATYDTAYAALYYPWLQVENPATGRVVSVPPCGHAAGVLARVDLLRGPHRSALNETIETVVDIHTSLLSHEVDALVRQGINPLVRSAGRGTVVLGSRTLSTDPERRYLHIQRLKNFIVRNIEQCTDWVLSERSSDTRVWGRIARDLEDFLSLLWRSGALAGDRADDAFVVRCDELTNLPEVLAADQIHAEVAVAARPASYLNFRIVYVTG